MRRLLPLPAIERLDLDDAYWIADPGDQHVRGVMVASVDGAAQANGRAGGLGSVADTRLFALLRRHADVLLVGAGTARAESYAGHRLTDAEQIWRRQHGLSQTPPPIAVVTRTCDLDVDGPLFTDTQARPIVVTCEAAPADRTRALAKRADVLVFGDSSVDMVAALNALAERGLRRVSCEGGPSLLAQVLAAGRIDELALTLSPLLLAGSAMRITDGPVLDPPVALSLTQLLEDEGSLFLRYSVHSTGEDSPVSA